MYKKCVSICIMAGMLFFSMMVGRAMMPERHSVSTLIRYLNEKAFGEPYAYARIMVMPDYESVYAEGTAEISWEFFQTAEAFEEFFLAKEEENGRVSFENTEYAMEFVYYQYQIGKDIHVLDLYHFLKKRYNRKEKTFSAIKASNKTGGYYFEQWPDRVMVFKEGVLYVMECKGTIDAEFYKEFARRLISRFTSKMSAADLEWGGWVLDDEDLYWMDHGERRIHMENPDRDFLEVRGIDASWDGQAFVENFAMLKEADYRLRLREDAPLLQIHFSFAGKIPETGYRTWLSNGSCEDEHYIMTVRNLQTNELYQQQNVLLSIELPDMISFLDLNADGYLDMQIDRPVHSDGERAVVEEYEGPGYMLYNPEKEIFESKKEHEVLQSLRQNRRREGYVTRYVVCPGDTLWGIAKKFYGTGSWYEKIEKENADVLSGEQYLLPGMSLGIPFDFPESICSR